MFEALEVAVMTVREIRDPVREISRKSAPLADQIRRAVESVALNLGEARWRVGRDRANRYRYAAGSAQEAHTALRVAIGWGYVTEDDVATALQSLERVMAMTFRLVKRR